MKKVFDSRIAKGLGAAVVTYLITLIPQLGDLISGSGAFGLAIAASVGSFFNDLSKYILDRLNA